MLAKTCGFVNFVKPKIKIAISSHTSCFSSHTSLMRFLIICAAVLSAGVEGFTSLNSYRANRQLFPFSSIGSQPGNQGFEPPIFVPETAVDCDSAAKHAYSLWLTNSETKDTEDTFSSFASSYREAMVLNTKAGATVWTVSPKDSTSIVSITPSTSTSVSVSSILDSANEFTTKMEETSVLVSVMKLFSGRIFIPKLTVSLSLSLSLFLLALVAWRSIRRPRL